MYKSILCLDFSFVIVYYDAVFGRLFYQFYCKYFYREKSQVQSIYVQSISDLQGRFKSWASERKQVASRGSSVVV
jgi:hypothetical protein